MQVLTYLGMHNMESLNLRQLLARRHSHRDWGILYTGMYVDSGELQCPYCQCDFLRDDVTVLNKKMTAFDIKMLNDKSRSRLT
jgi:hypothetical protein